MTTAVLALLVAIGSFCAGLLGALTGLGGGIVVVPMLTLLFHVDLRYAIGASLVSIIATSSRAAAAYVREGVTNVRLGSCSCGVRQRRAVGRRDAHVIRANAANTRPRNCGGISTSPSLART